MPPGAAGQSGAPMSQYLHFDFEPPSDLPRARHYILMVQFSLMSLYGMLRVAPLGLPHLLLVMFGQTTAMCYVLRQVPIYIRTRAALFDLTQTSLIGLLRMLLFGHVHLLLMLLFCQSTGRFSLLMVRLVGHLQAMPLGPPMEFLSHYSPLLVMCARTTAIPYGMRQALIFDRTRATLFDLTEALLVDQLRMLIGQLCLLLALYFCLSTGRPSLLIARPFGHL
ncbi:unnamed protein product [Prorocentrum cordatum]|uniref:Derlin n=1 Tax=Prorocentrum cordatum TaxID=2364126 RepID=A0ABN9TBN9_9DINO|nr:unnamed protein product [Polarella glacialis]